MRVLYVNQWQGLGGAEVSLLRLLEALPRTVVQPLLACPPGELADEARALNVQVFPVAFPSLRHGGKPAASDIERLSEAIAQSGLVHAYSVRTGWFAGALCRRLKVPMVWSIHDLFASLWQKVWLRMIARRYASAVVAYSNVLREQFGRGLAPKVYLIPHGVDVQRFAPVDASQRAEVRREVDTPPDAPVIVHVGRFMPFKGQHLFLQMAQMLAQEYSCRPVLWLCGDDSMGDHDYARRVQKMSEDVRASVRWLGFRRDIARVIASADVLVHCSTHPEPFGLVVLEAMACGTAVVSANAGAPTEIIQHGRTGLLSPPNDVPALARAVHDLLTDGSLRYRIAIAARDQVCEHYTLSKHVERLLTLYRGLL